MSKTQQQIQHIDTYGIRNLFRNGNREAVEQLLEDIKKYPVEKAQHYSFVVPFCMSHPNHYLGGEYLKDILKLYPDWVDAIDDQSGATALMLSIGNKNIKAFDFLIEHGANIKKKNRYGDTVLDYAVNYNDHHRIQELVVNMVLESAKFSKQNKSKALTEAIKSQQKGAVKALVEANAPIFHKNNNLLSLCFDSTFIDNSTTAEDIIDLLLKHKDVSKAINEGWKDEERYQDVGWQHFTPLHAAAGNGHGEKILQKLIDAGAQVNPRRSEYDETPPTPLMAAASNSNLEAMEFLLKAGAKTGYVDFEDRNAFFYLINCDLEFSDIKEDKSYILPCLKLLIDHGEMLVDPYDYFDEYRDEDDVSHLDLLINNAKDMKRDYLIDIFKKEEAKYLKKKIKEELPEVKQYPLSQKRQM